MPLLLDIQRVEQKLRLEKHSMPGGIVSDDLAADALGVGSSAIANLGITEAKIAAGAVTTTKLGAAAATLPKMDLRTGLKLLAADGVNSTGGDTEVTITGSAVGDRVVAIFGHVKANTGAHTFLIPVVGTTFEATISVVNKIVQKQAAGDLSANTYLFILAPAAA